MLTTRLPDRDSERERIIFAVAKIKREDPHDKTRILFDRKRSFQVPRNVAKRLPFWDFKYGSADWRTGLFRYCSDAEAVAYLRALFVHLKSPELRLQVTHLLTCVGSEPPDADEAFLEELERDPKSAAAEKYGSARGGEGPDHWRLKKHIEKHPELLGLGPVRRVHVEHSFVSGDRVDVALVLENGPRRRRRGRGRR